jgi:hypothetical protein
MRMRPTRIITATAGVTFCILAASATAAFAHGGMASPGELGQPLGASIALAFVCYWVVILWPSRKSNNASQSGRANPPRRRRLQRTNFGSDTDAGERSLKAVGRNGDG